MENIRILHIGRREVSTCLLSDKEEVVSMEMDLQDSQVSPALNVGEKCGMLGGLWLYSPDEQSAQSACPALVRICLRRLGRPNHGVHNPEIRAPFLVETWCHVCG